MKGPKYIRLEDYEEGGAGRLNSSSFSDVFSAEEIQRIDLGNCILGTITHSFDNTTLPIELDAIFADKEKEECINWRVS